MFMQEKSMATTDDRGIQPLEITKANSTPSTPQIHYGPGQAPQGDLRLPANPNQNPMKKLLCLFALLALVSPALAKPIRIMVFGDSISWGWEPNPNPPASDSRRIAAGRASCRRNSGRITR
jgi:hypothetical protein